MNINRYATVAPLVLLLATLLFTADTAQATQPMPIVGVHLGPEISDGHWNSVTVRDDRLPHGPKVLRDRVHVVSDSDPMGEWVTVEGEGRWLRGHFMASHTDEPGTLHVRPCDYVSAMYYMDDHRMLAGDASMAGTPRECPKDPILGRIEMLEEKVSRLCEYVQAMKGDLYRVCH